MDSSNGFGCAIEYAACVGKWHKTILGRAGCQYHLLHQHTTPYEARHVHLINTHVSSVAVQKAGISKRHAIYNLVPIPPAYPKSLYTS